VRLANIIHCQISKKSYRFPAIRDNRLVV
jgi:hypothetical protein